MRCAGSLGVHRTKGFPENMAGLLSYAITRMIISEKDLNSFESRGLSAGEGRTDIAGC